MVILELVDYKLEKDAPEEKSAAPAKKAAKPTAKKAESKAAADKE